MGNGCIAGIGPLRNKREVSAYSGEPQDLKYIFEEGELKGWKAKKQSKIQNRPQERDETQAEVLSQEMSSQNYFVCKQARSTGMSPFSSARHRQGRSFLHQVRGVATTDAL